MRNILLTPASNSLRTSVEMFERPSLLSVQVWKKCARNDAKENYFGMHYFSLFFFLNDPPSLYASFCLLSTWKSFPHAFKCVHILTGAFLCVYSCRVVECLAAFVLIFFVLAVRWARGPVVSQVLVERRISWSASGSLCRRTRRCQPK